MVEKFEHLLVDVRPGPRRDAIVGEEEVELGSTAAIEADLPRGVEERGREARLERSVENDHQVEATHAKAADAEADIREDASQTE